MAQQQLMSKNDFVKVLTTKEYNAKLVNGVVMVYIDSSEDFDRTIVKIQRLMDKHNYHSSFGVKVRVPRNHRVDSVNSYMDDY